MNDRTRVTLGLITDLHYADADPRGTRHYRESLPKVREALGVFQGKVDALVHLGDLVDSPASGPDPAAERAFLQTMDAEFRKLGQPRHFVLGNHCVVAITKREYLRTVGQRRSYYSFDRAGWHFVVLDACFRRDFEPYAPGNFSWDDTEIPLEERNWLEGDLARNRRKPTVVFCHQRLDLPAGHAQAVNRAADIRRILEASGNVRAVFMGHSHENALHTIGGIDYVTLQAMVEGSGPASSGYSTLECFGDGKLRLTGFRKHAEHPWPLGT